MSHSVRKSRRSAVAPFLVMDVFRRMLDGASVAATPGMDLDPRRGHRTVRFSFARGEAEIEGVRRMQRLLG